MEREVCLFRLVNNLKWAPIVISGPKNVEMKKKSIAVSRELFLSPRPFGIV